MALNDMAFSYAGRSDDQNHVMMPCAYEVAGGQVEDLLCVLIERIELPSRSRRAISDRGKLRLLVRRAILTVFRRTANSSWRMISKNSAWFNRIWMPWLPRKRTSRPSSQDHSDVVAGQLIHEVLRFHDVCVVS